MAEPGKVDIRSLIIGLLLGIVILLAVVVVRSHHRGHHGRHHGPEGAAAEQNHRDDVAVGTTGESAPAEHFLQEQIVARALEKNVQSLMSDIIGAHRSTVRIDVDLLFTSKKTQRHTVDPDNPRVVLNEETSESLSAETGTQESAVRSYGTNRTMEELVETGGVIGKLTMAFSVDATKVSPVAGHPGQYEEIERSAEEIEKLRQLAEKAVGFDAERGDEITVFALRFDKSQLIQAREEAVAGERKEFWTGVAINTSKIVFILIALLVARRVWRGNQSSTLLAFLSQPDSVTGLLIAGGLFLCAWALRLWGNSLSFPELMALPGLFFLIVGATRLYRFVCEPSEAG